MTNSSLKIHLITTNGINTHHAIKQFLNTFYNKYGYDEQELLIGKRCFLIAKHFEYGIVGGLCLNPPHSHPPFEDWKNRIVGFFQELNNCWMGSHLFFYLPEKIEDQLSDNQLIQLHSSVFKAFYHKLIHFSITWKLLEIRLLIDQEHYVNVNCGALPYLSERHFGLDEQAYILAHLSLPSCSYALFRGLINKLDTFNDQLLKQLVEEQQLQQLVNHPFQSTIETGYANTILH